jgi:hypothetical protein
MEYEISRKPRLCVLTYLIQMTGGLIPGSLTMTIGSWIGLPTTTPSSTIPYTTAAASSSSTRDGVRWFAVMSRIVTRSHGPLSDSVHCSTWAEADVLRWIKH